MKNSHKCNLHLVRKRFQGYHSESGNRHLCLEGHLKLRLQLQSLTVRAGHISIFLKSFRSVLEPGPLARSLRSRSFFSIVLFSFRSFTNRSNIFKNAFYAYVFFLEQWDLSWSFRLFSWKNDRFPGTTPSPTQNLSRVQKETTQMCLKTTLKVLFLKYSFIKNLKHKKNDF